MTYKTYDDNIELRNSITGIYYSTSMYKFRLLDHNFFGRGAAHGSSNYKITIAYAFYV